MARYSTWMADNLIEAVRKRAEEEDRPQSWVIEKALEGYLKIKAEKKPRGPQKAQPDTSPRPGGPRLRGQQRPKGEPVPTAETPKKNRTLDRELKEEHAFNSDDDKCPHGMPQEFASVLPGCVPCGILGRYGPEVEGQYREKYHVKVKEMGV